MKQHHKDLIVQTIRLNLAHRWAGCRVWSARISSFHRGFGFCCSWQRVIKWAETEHPQEGDTSCAWPPQQRLIVKRVIEVYELQDCNAAEFKLHSSISCSSQSPPSDLQIQQKNHQLLRAYCQLRCNSEQERQVSRLGSLGTLCDLKTSNGSRATGTRKLGAYLNSFTHHLLRLSFVGRYYTGRQVKT
jgi:hypothetical protein